MHPTPLRRAFLVAGPALVALLLGLLLFVGMRRSHDLARAVQITFAAQAELERAIRELREAEARARGFFLTGDERHWDAGHGLVERVEERLARLDGLLTDPQQREGIAALRPMVRTRLELLEETVARFRSGELAGAALEERLQESHDLMLAIGVRVTAWEERQERLLGERYRAEERNARIVLAIVVLGTLLSVVIAALANALLVRQAAAQAAIAEELEERNLQLEEQAVELEHQTEEMRVQTAALEEAVTERDRAAEQLRERERMLSTLLANLPGMVYRCRNDDSWTMEFVSRGCQELTGYHARELVENRSVAYAELIHPADRDQVRDAVREAVRKRRPYQVEYRLIRADRAERCVWERGQPVFSEEGELAALEGFVGDVTEQRQAQERLARSEAQLRHAQKMEAVGRLAGGIAHDFNNILGVIGGTAELAQMEVPQGSRLREDLEEIVRASDRAADLTRQLLAFSRQQVLQPEVVDLNEIVAGTERLLRRTLPENIEFVTRPAEHALRVRVDPGQIEQILLNLAINARDAMPGGGKLITETRAMDLDERWSADHPHTMEPGSYVVLSVSDTGHGMDEETLSRVFEPFFTTKAQGHGTGLGLSTVYGIVQQSEGHVTVYSEEGLGTTFTIYLPRVSEKDEERPNPRPRPEEGSGMPQSGTILLVEDESALRAVAQRALERAGYTVLAAGDGDAALRLLEAHQVDLLLSDVVMPRMGGAELSQRARALRPGLKVLFTSGYTDEAVVQRQLLEGGAAFVQKPYAPGELVRRVAGLLGRERETA